MLGILGATGYTGQLVLEYLDQLFVTQKLKPSLAVCIGGRDEKKLRELCKAKCPHMLSILTFAIVDVTNEQSVFSFVGGCHTVLSCVGPYDLLGEPVVKACVSMRTHYVDITGENRWVERMKEKYGDAAQRNGVTLVPFAGHDCVPADLVAWLATSQVFPRELEGSHAALTTIVKMAGGGTLSNGTFQTFLHFAETGKIEASDQFPQPLLNSRLSENIAIVNDIPPSEGGPLAVWPIRLMPDPIVVHESYVKGVISPGTGAFENIHAVALPNRVIAHGASLGVKLFPYIVQLPFVLNRLKKLLTNGQGVKLGNKKDVGYNLYAILKLYPLKGISEKPMETIVTNLYADRDPYLITAITCTQIALALLEERDVDQPKASGFQTPVNAIGGQELLERCAECFRIKLVSRL